MRDKFRELYKQGKIPTGVMSLGQAESVYDVRVMIGTHLDMLDGPASDKVKRPYKLRLEKLLIKLDK